jgi:hypothetical protein
MICTTRTNVERDKSQKQKRKIPVADLPDQLTRIRTEET